MRTIRTLAPLLGALLLAACADDLMIEDFNNPGVEELTENPTAAAVASGAQGLLIGMRDEFDDRNGYVSLLGILGRESYNFDGSDPRFITEMLEGDLSPQSPAFGGNLWINRYANIRLGNTILAAVDVLDDAELSPEDKAAVRGFTKTMQAHEFLLLVNTRDVNGAAIDVDLPPDADPAPLVPKSQVFDRIAMLLDDARNDLDAAGSSFPFTFHSGYSGFDTPPAFREFNRALKARVDVYMGNFTEAQINLGFSFLNETASLTLGVYHAFSGAPGDEVNELFDPGDSPDILAHPAIVTDAELGDLRVANKIRSIAPRTVLGITTDVAFTIYNSISAPIPIIRNEELILLRAEVRIALGNISGAGSAEEDINIIRAAAGLAPVTLTAANAMDQLVFERRYSLMFEGGHRWIDTRRLGRFGELPLDTPFSQVNAAFPIPEAECLARGAGSTCSAS